MFLIPSQFVDPETQFSDRGHFLTRKLLLRGAGSRPAGCRTRWHFSGNPSTLSLVCICHMPHSCHGGISRSLMAGRNVRGRRSRERPALLFCFSSAQCTVLSFGKVQLRKSFRTSELGRFMVTLNVAWSLFSTSNSLACASAANKRRNSILHRCLLEDSLLVWRVATAAAAAAAEL